MKHILTSSLPAMIFAGGVLLVYYLYFQLWLRWLIRRLRKKDSKKMLTSAGAIALHLIAGIGIACMSYAYFVEPYWPEISIVPIETDKLTETTYRVVQITDTHCDEKVRLEKRLPDLINKLKPDVIVFTGDALNTRKALGLFQNTLNQLEAPLGKYAVNGNWNVYYSDLKLFENTGFQELRTHAKTIEKNGESIVIGGLAFENGRKSQRLFNQLEAEDFNLLLYHNSDMMDYIATVPVDLYLCGHTHGGQVALPFYGALITLSRHGKKFEAGLYQQGETQLYVNRGIGMEGGRSPKVRFFARPEIAVFDIGPKKTVQTSNSKM